jgi:hypothetical protein
MAHPFFDAPRYPWWREPEAVELHLVLYQAVQAPAQIDTFYQRCREGLSPLNLAQAPHLIWREALTNLTVAGALRQLCEALRNEATLQSSAVQKALRAVFDAQPLVRMRVTRGGIPVLDRDRLREQLEVLDNDTHPLKVLLVRGARGSGKSHGRYLFEMAARDRGAVPLYLCDGLIATVEDAVREIFSALTASKEVPPVDTSDDAWYRTVCRQMLEVARRNNQSMWIAVDDLGQGPDGAPLLDPRIRKFCDQLAMSMVNPPFKERFRLMLIDYPLGDVPTRWKSDFWDQDCTAEADIRAEHVAEVLTWWAAARRRTLLEADVQQLTQQVIAAAEPAAGGAVPPDGRPRLRRIFDALEGVLKKL